MQKLAALCVWTVGCNFGAITPGNHQSVAIATSCHTSADCDSGLLCVADHCVAATASQAAFSIDPPLGATADGVAVVTVTVTLKDPIGKFVSGAPVSLAVAGDRNTIVPALATTNTEGVAVFSVTSTKAESKGCSITTAGNTIDVPASVIFTPGPPGSHSLLVATPATLAADDVSVAQLAFVCADDFGNTCAQGASIRFGSDGTQETFTAGDGLIDAAAARAATVRSRRAGVRTISAYFHDTAIATTALTFTPGPAAKLVFTRIPSDTYTLGTMGAEVITRDVFDNPTPSDALVTLVGDGTGTLTGTLSAQAVAGVATFADVHVDRASPAHTLRAQASGLSDGVSAPFSVVAWHNLTPTFDDVTVMAAGTTSIYVGTENSLLRSVDGGVTFATYALPQGHLVRSVSVSPNNDDIVYVGVTDGGLLKSLDGGRHFTELAIAGIGDIFQTTTSVVAMSDTAIVVSAGTPGSSEIFVRSDDGGATFSAPVTLQLGTLAVASPMLLYHVTATEVDRSQNGGLSWAPFSTGLGSAQNTAIATHPTDPTIAYVGQSDGSVYRLNGESWAPMTPASGAWITSLDANASGVWLASDRAYFAAHTDTTWTPHAMSPASAVLDIALGTGTTVYALTARQIRRSSDAGATWSSDGQVFMRGQPTQLFASGNGTVYVLGSHDVFFSQTRDGPFNPYFSPPAGTLHPHSATLGVQYIRTSEALYVDNAAGGYTAWPHAQPTDPLYSFMTSGILCGGASCQIYTFGVDTASPPHLSRLFGPGNTEQAKPVPNAFGISDLVMLSDPRLLLATDDGVYVSTAIDTPSWTLKYSGGAVFSFWSTEAALYARGSKGVLVSTNSGDSFVERNAGLPSTPTVVAGTASAVVYVAAYASGIYRSDNSGGAWQAANSGIENANINSVAPDPHHTDLVYAAVSSGASSGVYVTYTGGR